MKAMSAEPRAMSNGKSPFVKGGSDTRQSAPHSRRPALSCGGLASRVASQRGFLHASLMAHRASLLLPALLCLAAPGLHAATTANPKALPIAQAILNYLYNLPNHPDKRVVSGQFDWWNSAPEEAEFTNVHTQTGHWPGIFAVTFNYGDGETNQDKISVAIDHWNHGGIVSVWPGTLGYGQTVNPDLGNINVTDAITPGTPSYPTS